VRIRFEVISGPDAGRLIHLQEGLVARFGKTDWADFSFPADAGMADFHFLIDCRQQRCVLQALDSAPTQVNAAVVKTQELAAGDRVLASQTEFRVHLEGVFRAAEETAPGVTRDAIALAAAALTLPELCERLKLGGQAPTIAATASDLPALYGGLAAVGDYQQALQVRGYTLGHRPCVAWGCYCVEQTLQARLAGVQREAHQAAAAWVQAPSPANCRAAEAAAVKADYKGPGGWLAAAAFWCGDSLAPPDAATPVPPADTLASRAVAGALTITLRDAPAAAASGTATAGAITPARRCADWLAIAEQIASGERVLYEA
jgi:hypothetical protein